MPLKSFLKKKSFHRAKTRFHKRRCQNHKKLLSLLSFRRVSFQFTTFSINYPANSVVFFPAQRIYVSAQNSPSSHLLFFRSFTAMVVRFITRRFIGDYDSCERVYMYNTTIDNEIVNFEILDSTGQLVIAEHKSVVRLLKSL